MGVTGAKKKNVYVTVINVNKSDGPKKRKTTATKAEGEPIKAGSTTISKEKKPASTKTKKCSKIPTPQSELTKKKTKSNTKPNSGAAQKVKHPRSPQVPNISKLMKDPNAYREIRKQIAEVCQKNRNRIAATNRAKNKNGTGTGSHMDSTKEIKRRDDMPGKDSSASARHVLPGCKSGNTKDLLNKLVPNRNSVKLDFLMKK